jgi:hypothetical protein
MLISFQNVTFLLDMNAILKNYYLKKKKKLASHTIDLALT